MELLEMSILHGRPPHFCSFYQVVLEPTSPILSPFEYFIPFSFQEFIAFQRKKLRKLEKKIVVDKSVF